MAENNKKCHLCNKVFSRPIDLERHKNRKRPCFVGEVAPEHLNNPKRCKYCNKIFAQPQTLVRHLKICKIKENGPKHIIDNAKIELNIEIIKEQGNEIRSLKEKIQLLEQMINEQFVQNFNKTEHKLLNVLKRKYNVEPQKRFDWCRGEITERHLPFDFLLPDYNIMIELDGPQHFRQISNWKSPEEQQKIDHYKMDKAILHGYTIIRILQEDVCDDKYKWWPELQKHVHVHQNPISIYMCKNNEYDCYLHKE